MPRKHRDNRTHRRAATLPERDQAAGQTALAAVARGRWLAVAIAAALVAFGALEFYRATFDPAVPYLSRAEGAAWIRTDEPFRLGIYRTRERSANFSHPFVLAGPVAQARLRVRSFRRCEVRLDGVEVFRGDETWEGWKRTYDVVLAGPLAAGRHELAIAVENQDAHACLWLSCPELGLRTGPGWAAAGPGEPMRAALLATSPVPPEVVAYYPTVAECFRQLIVWLAALFVLLFGALWWRASEAAGGWQLTPARLRWCLLAAWVVLAVNNFGRLPLDFGYDADGHEAYVQYVAKNRALPLATDGWQMFQAPLLYLLEAPWYAAVSALASPEAARRALRVLPLLCGLAQIELVYRIARAVFPRENDLQIVATVVGGLMPMNLYISQVLGNEPLAGCLTSLTTLLCLLLIVDPTPRRGRFFAALGAVWGLAILAKVTPLVMAPLVVAAIVAHARASGSTIAIGGLRSAIALGVCLLVSGWYFARNVVYLGKPFTDGWNPELGIAWWQDPSYRTWPQLASFGTALVRPVYSGCWSYWDAIYSTMWLDAFTSGRVDLPSNLPWNVPWMTVGAWLGLVPLALILAGAGGTIVALARTARGRVWFPLVLVLLYLLATMHRYLGFPIFGIGKATYLLGLLPCLGLLAAAGARPLVRVEWLRAVLFALLGCWAVAAYVAYFSLA